MIIDEIILHDFGLYRGEQRIELTPPEPGKPITLIGGLNGGGKTTLLDALQLVLFGRQAKCSNRGALAYPEYLSRCIHREKDNTEAGIEMAFRHTVEGRQEHYRLRRFWKAAGNGCKERFEISRNGHAEPALADNWATQVEEFFPANIAHLFLFDGEQVEAYASQSDSSALIGAAIRNLLGLDMVDQLEKDLLIYERRKRSEENDCPRHAEIMSAQDKARDLRQRIDEKERGRDFLQADEIDKQRRALRKVEDKYRRSGGGLHDQKDAIEKKWSDALRDVREAETALRDFAGGGAPLALARALLESTASRDQHEEECRRSRDLAGALAGRDKAVIKRLAGRVDNRILEELNEFFHADRARHEELGRKGTVLDITSEARSDLQSLLRGGLERIRADAENHLSRQNRRRRDEEQARVEHESIPRSDAIEGVAKEREELRARVAGLEVLHAAMGKEIEQLQRELERQEQSLARLLEGDARNEGRRDDRSRILRHSGKVRGTLEAFRHAVIARHVERIEQLVLESYKQLLRKRGLVTRLSIDPEGYALTLFGRDDEPLNVERLSAGERQLLAVALLWGLAKASGRPLPTAIDTPLGRLDSVHRMRFVERYLPYASHQILLLSTDEEIAGDYLERLRPWIGHTYHLAFDDKTGATRVTRGYLESREAA